MFASQAGAAIANARKHRDEQRARADLEALIDTSPVGVVVFDARLGRWCRSIGGETHCGGPAHAGAARWSNSLTTLTFRRADGREVSLAETPLAQALREATTVRVEEIVIQVPDGRSITTLINATSIHSEDGEIESVVVTLQDMTPLGELERMRAEFLGLIMPDRLLAEHRCQ